MEDECVSDPNNRVRDISSANSSSYGYIKATRAAVYKGGLNCHMKIKAPPGYLLSIYINWIDIYKEEDMVKCTSDFLQLDGTRK